MSLPRPILLTAFGVLLDTKGRVLLARRMNTGAADGKYGLPGGRLEIGEDLLAGLIREIQEEIGCVVRREDCELAVIHHALDGAVERIDAQFFVRAWQGEPSICEPDKADHMGWFYLDRLPVLGSITEKVLRAVREGRIYCESV